MKVWILQTGEPLHIDKNISRPMRAMNLSNALVNRGHRVLLWSANFDHLTKKHRYKNAKTIDMNNHFKIKLLKSIGYTKNQGISRLFDHAQLAKASCPCSLPPPATANVCVSACEQLGFGAPCTLNPINQPLTPKPHHK